MKIQHIELNEYIPHQYNKMKHFSAEYTSPVQIFIGSNGCGKSATLSVHDPLPTTKTQFHKNGSIKLSCEHDNHMFDLTNDYKEKSPYSFEMDGEELNISHTSSVQRDLVEKYLGFNKLTYKLTHNLCKMSEMTKSARKDLLIECNPIDITFIVDKHKRISKRLRACKNQLTLLYRRKGELESQLLDKSILEARCKESDILNEDLGRIRNSLAEIRGMVNQKEIELDFTRPMDEILFGVEKLSKNIEKDSERISYGADYADSRLRKNLSKESGVYKSKIESIKEEIKDHVDKHLEYKQYLNSKEYIDITSLEQEIESCKKELKEIEYSSQYPCIPKEQMQRAESEIVLMKSVLSQFDSCDMYHLISKQQFHKLESKLSYLENKYVNPLSQRLDSLGTQLKEIKDEINEHKKIAPPDECAFDFCILQKRFKERYTQLTKQAKEINLQVILVSKQHTKYSHIADRLNTLYESHKESQNALNNFRTQWTNMGGWFHSLMENVDVMSTLKSDYMHFVKMMTECYTNSFIIHKETQLKEKEKALYERLSVLIKKGIKGKDVIIKYIDELDKLIEQKKKTLIEYTSEYNSIEKKITCGELYTEYTQKYASSMDDMENTFKTETIHYQIDVMRITMDILQSASKRTMDKLSEITAITHEQEKLRSRYEDEILQTIKEVEKERDELIPLEHALSPDRGIPNQYLLKTLGKCIANANHFLQNMWTYPLQLCPLPKDKPVSFRFPVKIHNSINSDISLCSDGQKDAINLSLNLALLIHLGIIKDYPLFLDEPDKHMDSTHREKFLEFLSSLVSKELVSQLFLINHHASLHSGFNESETVCLNSDNVIVPNGANAHVEMS